MGAGASFSRDLGMMVQKQAHETTSMYDTGKLSNLG